MQLKKIELHGFKSFADRTTFAFGGGISAVVGPNGSGKSNLVDAVKWVLGEQKVKTLRAEESTDVIFSGNDHRRALSFAEASLVLDNTSRAISLDTDEVTITRRLYRDSTSEYLLNGRRVRLKDVRDAISGTGLGVNEYSIIEQGKVDSLVLLSPMERRALFDEAAGILRYKERRNESAKRLEKVRQNLERLTDIVNEVAKQKQSLQSQANKARKFIALREQLDRARLDLFVVRYRTMLQVVEQRENALVELENQYASLLSEYGKLSVESEDLAKKQSARREAADLARSEMVRLEGVLAKVENDLEWCDRRKTELASRAKDAQAEAGRLRERTEHLQSETQKLMAEKEGLVTAREEREKVVNDIRNELSGLEPQLADARVELRSVEEKRESERSASMERDREVTRLTAKLDTLAERRDWALGEIDKTSQRSTAVVNEIAEVEQVLRTLADELREIGEKEKAATAGIEEADKEISALKADRDRLNAEVALSSRRLAHLTEKGERQKKASEPRFGDGIRVAEGWELAAEAMLGPFFSAVVCERGAMPERGFGVFPSSTELVRVPLAFEGGVPASSKIECEPRLKGALNELCNGVFFADVLPLDKPLPAGITVIDRKGAILTRFRAVSSAGRDSAEDSELVRKAEIARLQSALSAIREHLKSTEAQLAEANSRRSDQIREAAENSKLRRRCEVNIHLRNERRAGFRHEQAALRATLSELRARLEENERETATVGSALSVLGPVLPPKQEGPDKFETAIIGLRSTLGSLNRKREGLMARLSDARVAAATASERVASLLSRLATMKGEMTELASRANDRDSAAVKLAEESWRNEEKKNSLVGEIARVNDDLRSLKAAYSSRLEELQQIEGELSVASSALKEAGARLDSLRDQREKDRLELTELKTRMSGLVERTMEETGIPLEEESQRRDIGSSTEKGLLEEISDCEKKLGPLKSVNLEAVDLLSEVEDRHEFLLGHQKDLETSARSLQELVTEMNERCRTMFTETFERVSKSFQEVFRKLFGGGRAEISLLEGDVLEAGVEISVRPPGKDPKTVNLLSGGEKALTAIALLLAMFRANPSPFCILDEVDAPLDESNIERFIMLLREFCDRSQFLVVSHSRRTIERVDSIFGITIDREGVSRTVSVQLERAREMLETPN